MGAGARCGPLYPLVSTPDGRYGRETRRLCRAGRSGRRAGGVLRQAARAAGARRLVVPQRRHPQYVRGPRLLGLGPHVARLHRRHDALYPYRLHRLHGRGARLQSAPAALADGHRQGRHGGVPLFRQECREGLFLSGLGAGIFPRGREPLGRASRPDAHGAYAHGTRVGQEPAVGRPLFRGDSDACDGLYEGPRIRVPEVGNSGQDAPQRGGSQSVRAGSGLRGGQPGQRPQPVADDHYGQDRPPSPVPRAAARKTLQRDQRIRASTTTGRWEPIRA